MTPLMWSLASLGIVISAPSQCCLRPCPHGDALYFVSYRRFIQTDPAFWERETANF